MRTLKKTLLVLCGLLLMPLMHNAQDAEVTLDFENAATANELIQNYIQGLKDGDVAKMSAQLDENAMLYGLGGGLDSLNVSQHMQFWTDNFSSNEHSITNEAYLPVKVTNAWNEGEWVLVWGTNTVTDKEGKNTVTIPYHNACFIVNGKIARIHYYYDNLNIMTAQGFTLTPPSK